MKHVRAIICDVYKTILDVREAPADAEERWRSLFGEAFGSDSPLTLEALATRCRSVILEDHNEARARGISYPEVNWPSVMKRALPMLASLPQDALDTLIFQHAQLSRTLRIMPGCCDVLRECAQRGILIGIASNAQAYTLREIRLALRESDLDASIFQSDLTFWSFEHGFSKPDPHVFQILRARLKNRHIETSETLMIGDREDNDISPARAVGWQTWQFSGTADNSTRRDWGSLALALFQ
jgi:FMN phosphatase YigB (HAD superfamily)